MHFFSHSHNIVAIAHLYREKHTLSAVALYVFISVGILAHYTGYVFQSDNISVFIRVDYLLAYLTLSIVRVGHMYRQYAPIVLNGSAQRGESLHRQLRQYRISTYAIAGHLLTVQVNRYLLIEHTRHTQSRHRIDAAQLIFERL